jgi:hypothetical protein
MESNFTIVPDPLSIKKDVSSPTWCADSLNTMPDKKNLFMKNVEDAIKHFSNSLEHEN